MTNTEIIFKEAIANKIYTKEEAQKIIEEQFVLPIHTFMVWKELGYSIKKGEHAKITTRLWKPCKGKKKEDSESDENTINMYLCKAFLFTREQVEKTA